MSEVNTPGGNDGSPLTVDQQDTLNALKAFVLDGREKCFLLEGYAGTGKTFLIRRLAQWLGSIDLSFMLAAPTGRASKVLADKTGYAAGTIHRSIYSMDKLLEIPNAQEEDRFKFYYALKLVAEDDRPRVIIVDESSMVSDVESDEKFFRFGSGRLLTDLMVFAGTMQPDSKCKVVFVGDPAQLPPVGMNSSPALDADYLGKEFGVESRRAVLRQVVRQAEGSAILETATQIRADIEQQRFNRLDINPDGKEMVEVGLEQVLDLWARECPKDCESSASPPLICVTWKNDTALAYNASVRAKLLGRGDGLHPVMPKDYLMVVANNRKTGLWNGELVLVQAVDGESEHHLVALRTQDGPKQVKLSFRKVTVAVPGVNGSVTTISSMILENVLFGKERDVADDELIAQWVFFKNRHMGLTPGTEQFRQELNEDPYFNALRVKFGYAVTCNKAQGGEWPNAVVVFERGRPTLDCLRWTYTAITRAKKTLYGVGFPHYGIIAWARAEGAIQKFETGEDDDHAGEADLLNPEKTENDASSVLFEEDIQAFRRAGFPAEMDWILPQHIAALREWRDAGIAVERIEPSLPNHFFRYHLAKMGHRAMIQVYFRKNHSLNPQPCRSNSLPECAGLVDECNRCIRRGYQAAIQEPVSNEVAELGEFQGRYDAAIQRLGGVRLSLKHFPYRERFRGLSSQGGIAVIDFPYNGRMQFHRPPEIQPETTDRVFALAIIRELEK